MKNQRKATLFALGTVLCWSTIGSAMKLTVQQTDLILLLLISNLVAFLFFLITLIIQKKFSSLLHLTRRNIAMSALLGLLNPFLYYLVLLMAYNLLPAQEAGTLNYIWPIILVLLSIPLLGQRVTAWSFLAILISFTGLLVISTQGDLLSFTFSDPYGVALAIGSALFWALYWILNIKDSREPVSKLFLNFTFGLIYILIVYMIIGDTTMPSLSGLAGGIYLGIFEMGLPFILWLKALQWSATTAKVSNLIYISPFLSLILIHFLIGESILPATIIGLILIISGILLQQFLRK